MILKTITAESNAPTLRSRSGLAAVGPLGLQYETMGKVKTRDEMIRVRFTTDELAVARARAKAEGVPVSTYLRRLAITTRLAPEESEARVKRALAAFGSLSSGEADELRGNVRDVREGWARGRS